VFRRFGIAVSRSWVSPSWASRGVRSWPSSRWPWWQPALHGLARRHLCPSNAVRVAECALFLLGGI